jgi:hypothetical protein
MSDICAEWSRGEGFGTSIKSDLYNDQLWINKKFIQPMPIEEWLDGEDDF